MSNSPPTNRRVIVLAGPKVITPDADRRSHLSEDAASTSTVSTAAGYDDQGIAGAAAAYQRRRRHDI